MTYAVPHHALPCRELGWEGEVTSGALEEGSRIDWRAIRKNGEDQWERCLDEFSRPSSLASPSRDLHFALEW